MFLPIAKHPLALIIGPIMDYAGAVKAKKERKREENDRMRKKIEVGALFFELEIRRDIPLDMQICQICTEIEAQDCEILGMQYLGRNTWEVQPLNGKLAEKGHITIGAKKITIFESDPRLKPSTWLKIRGAPLRTTGDEIKKFLVTQGVEILSEVSFGLARLPDGTLSKFQTGGMAMRICLPKRSLPKK